MNKEESIIYLKNIELILISLICLILPSFFLTNTLETIIFPKQILTVGITIILLILYSIRSLIEGKITVKSTPFNIPILLFTLAVFVSALLSRNFLDSVTTVTPVLMLSLLYFTIINSLEDTLSLKIVFLSLLFGGVLSALISLLQYFKLYIFPFPATQSPTFTVFGTPVQHIIYLLPLFLIALHSFLLAKKKSSENYDFIYYILILLLSGFGIFLLLFQYVTASNKPLILPYQYGFQIALASISQDTLRLLPSFLFGSGYGTFLSDFTKYKLPAYNLEPNLWTVTFSSSSSFLLETIATTGIIGLICFLFLIYKIIKVKTKAGSSGVLIGILSLIVLSILLPFSYSSLFLLFVLLAIFSIYLYVENSDSVYNLTLSFVALKHGLLNFSPQHNQNEKSAHKALPILFSVVIFLLTGFVGFFSTKLLISDLKFKNSIDAVSINNGKKSYDLEREAINDFPYRSDYYRIFSQLNLALANSLLSQVPQGSTPSAEVQQTALTLMQQSINAGRTAATLAPLNSINWLTLSGVYRNLINIGQNAEQFSIGTLQQAIALDPNNPTLYIELGGIYYQLGQFEAAQNQFTIAARLKPDFTNAYYNLGHALESKGDLQNALNQYVVVRELTKNDKANLKKISDEISILQQKIGKVAKIPESPNVLGSTSENQQAKFEQEQLKLSTPSARQLKKEPPISIPPPPTASESGT